jgi:hypothetical protein
LDSLKEKIDAMTGSYRKTVDVKSLHAVMERLRRGMRIQSTDDKQIFINRKRRKEHGE